MLSKMKMENESDYKLLKKIFLWVSMIFMLGPWFFGDSLRCLCSDLMVQVKSGLWMIENQKLLSSDIFSWHTNLNWCPHETGFYFLAALIYKIAGVYGCILLSSLSVLYIYVFYFIKKIIDIRY